MSSPLRYDLKNYYEHWESGHVRKKETIYIREGPRGCQVSVDLPKDRNISDRTGEETSEEDSGP